MSAPNDVSGPVSGPAETRASVLVALLVVVAIGTGCEAHASYESTPRGPAGEEVRADTLIVREDSTRGVACYQVAFRPGLSCVKVR